MEQTTHATSDQVHKSNYPEKAIEICNKLVFKGRFVKCAWVLFIIGISQLYFSEMLSIFITRAFQFYSKIRFLNNKSCSGSLVI